MSDAFSRAAIERLTLLRFRNHVSLSLEVNAGPVALVGPNGAGKTNILEALSMLGPGRGLRGTDLRDLTWRAGSEDEAPPIDHWVVSSLAFLGAEETRLGVGLEDDGRGGMRRVARLNGKTVGPKALAETVRMIWMTPVHDRLFAGPAADRRRFFDRLVTSIVPEHSITLNTYESAQRQRQRLIAEENWDTRWLGVLEREMAASGTAIAASRLDVLHVLQRAIDQRADTVFPKAALRLEGLLEAKLAEANDSIGVEAEFSAHLASVRARDAAAGRAIDGPHRSDLKAIHLSNNMDAADCSTGEQKALVIGLVLAHAARVGEARHSLFGGPCPIVLLDEACAHLDKARREALCEELTRLPGQAWVTGTDAELFAGFGSRATVFAVRPGHADRLA